MQKEEILEVKKEAKKNVSVEEFFQRSQLQLVYFFQITRKKIRVADNFINFFFTIHLLLMSIATIEY